MLPGLVFLSLLCKNLETEAVEVLEENAGVEEALEEMINRLSTKFANFQTIFCTFFGDKL